LMPRADVGALVAPIKPRAPLRTAASVLNGLPLGGAGRAIAQAWSAQHANAPR
jgi:hypothetical protein